MPGKHDGQRINQMINLWCSRGGQGVRQRRAESLKSRLQAVQPQHKSLITGQAWKPLAPVLFNQAMHLLLLEAALEVGEEPDG